MLAFFMVTCYTDGMDTVNKDFRIEFQNEVLNLHYTLECHPSQNPYYRHNHPHFELYLLLEGEVNFVVEGKAYELCAGMALLIPPFAYHFAKNVHEDRPYRRVAIHFDRACALDALGEWLPSQTYVYPLDGVRFERDLALVGEAVGQYAPEDTALLVKMLLNRFLLHFKYGGTLQQEASGSANSTVNQILEFINERIYEPLCTKSIAKALFLSPTYVSQIFSSHMKIGLMEYIKRKKVLLASELIASGTKPTAAAAQLGFAEYSTFFRLYKKHLGHPPSE